MDYVPAQDEDYGNQRFDDMTLVCHPEARIRVVYRDWEGVEQRRLMVRGTWPVKSSMILGYQVPEPDGAGGTQWSAVQDLSELGLDMELSVGWGLETDLPRAIRRGR